MNEGNRVRRILASAARVFVAATVLIFAGLGVGALVTTLGSGPPQPEESRPANNPFARTSLADPAVRTAPQSAAEISGARRTPTVIAAVRVLPSVVSLRTERTVQSQDMFDRFFNRRGRSRVEAGLGSGFAIDDAGTIITNAHVVSGADRIEVVDRDGQRFEAEVVGFD